ncbi:MAG: efflux RND transporter periplasmic adaptor subunit [Bacteroidia bacterium]|nr:efflux RND transporter periplasmic adaptor subunit [Bacteroidia bacterium]MDW8158116.1 efflux RND transporter periplasmic adaptor subunit [Bacteroidia bacterium]
MKKALLYILVLGGITALIVNTLYSNKKTLETKKKPVAIKPVAVTTAEVIERKFEDNLLLIGTIIPNRDVMVVSETQGKAKQVTFEVGDYKQAGSVLVKVDDELKKANLESAQATYEKAQKDLQRLEELYKKNVGTLSQLEQARHALKIAETQLIVARRQFHDTEITAPISGIITSRLVETGSMLAPGSPVANIIDISQLKVRVNVPEMDVFKLKVGSQVKITTEVYPGVNYTGTIRYISSKGDEAHTYPVEIILSNNPQYPLKAGMYAKIEFLSIDANASLAIPRKAITGSTKEPIVYVVQGNRVKQRKILVGKDAGNYIQVLSGLEPGEQVVTSGQINLQDNTLVSVVNEN